MSSLEKMVAMAVEATGDESIFVAGDFQPKGMTWKRAAGTAAGSALGGAVSGGDAIARTAGAIGGFAAGTLATAGTNPDLPPFVVLAASPDKLYVLTHKRGMGAFLSRHLELLHVLDREDLVVTLKKRATVRTAIIEDEATGYQLKLEGVKLGFHHMNDILNDLDDEEHAEAVAQSEALLAGGDI
ncbi:MAG: hypothetical protein WCC01_02340 [Acidimicrobiia bacterium]